MKLLAIDTSNRALAVAVLEDTRLLASIQLNQKMNHSLTLMPTIDRLMKSCELKPTDLDRIVVAEGPGSYTGIRIAATTAKTLADTLKIELVGVSSLATIAANVHTTKWIVPLMDARRGNVYAGVYQWQENQLTNVFSDVHIACEELLESLTEPVIFVGETAAFAEKIQEKLPTAEIIRQEQWNLPNGAALGNLGLTKQPIEDIHRFVPAYLKRVEAEEKWLQTHQSDEGGSYVEKI